MRAKVVFPDLGFPIITIERGKTPASWTVSFSLFKGLLLIPFFDTYFFRRALGYSGNETGGCSEGGSGFTSRVVSDGNGFPESYASILASALSYAPPPVLAVILLISCGFTSELSPSASFFSSSGGCSSFYSSLFFRSSLYCALILSLEIASNLADTISTSNYVIVF